MRWSVSHGAPCGRRQWQVLTRRERAAAGRGAYRGPRLCRAGWQVPEEWRQLSAIRSDLAKFATAFATQLPRTRRDEAPRSAFGGNPDIDQTSPNDRG